MKKLLLLALACAATLPATRAQTGRIAHFSHGGSPGALTQATDNMGLPDVVYKELKIVLVSDTTVVVQGWERWAIPNAAWRPVNRAIQFRTFARDTLREGPGYFTRTPNGTRVLPLDVIKSSYPQARLVGFAKLRKVIHRKSSSYMPSFWKLPSPYSHWRELTTVVALGAVGWLLNKKRPA